MLNALCVVCINCHCIINSASRRTVVVDGRESHKSQAWPGPLMPKMKKRQRKDSTAFVYNLITTNCLFICIYIYGRDIGKVRQREEEKRGTGWRNLSWKSLFVFFCARWFLFHLSVVSNLCSSIYQSISYEFLISGFSCAPSMDGSTQ